MQCATVRLELDKRRPSSRDNRFPVRFIVSCHGRWKRYSTVFRFDTREWNLMWGPKLLNKDLKSKKNDLEKELVRANDVLETLDNEFSFEKFERLFLGKLTETEKRQLEKEKRQAKIQKQKENVYNVYQEYLKELEKSKRIGTANAYRNSMKSLQSYRPKLSFADITPKFLERYEVEMISRGMSLTTVGIYLRGLRAIYNIAIMDGVVSRDNYPFGPKKYRKYEIPIGRNIKKALDIEDIRKIKNANSLPTEHQFARDMWMFSFYCNGMNMADIFFLRFESIDGRFMRFYRKKTERTRRDVLPIEIYLLDDALAILNRWKVKETSPSDYVFGLTSDNDSPEEQFRQKKNFTRSINQHMKTLGKQLGIKSKLTTYVARHSYATMLKNLGVSVEEISESLGHNSIETTRNYLASFSQNRKKSTAEKLRDAL